MGVKSKVLIIKNGAEAHAVRKKMGLNQKAFWSKIGVTQSGGSRYESGREIPDPALFLLNFAYANTSSRTRMVKDLDEGKLFV